MKQRYRNITLLSPISRINDHLHKSRHSWVEVGDEVQHGGAGGGDELLTHGLQPPVHLEEEPWNERDWAMDTDLLPGVPQLLLDPRTGVEEELQQGVVRWEREQVRPVSI